MSVGLNLKAIVEFSNFTWPFFPQGLFMVSLNVLNERRTPCSLFMGHRSKQRKGFKGWDRMTMTLFPNQEEGEKQLSTGNKPC